MGVARKHGKHKTHEGGCGCGWVGASSGGGNGDGHMDGCHALEVSFHGAGVSRVGGIRWCVHWEVLCLQVAHCGKW